MKVYLLLCGNRSFWLFLFAILRIVLQNALKLDSLMTEMLSIDLNGSV
jgi:hypothetical protein